MIQPNRPLLTVTQASGAFLCLSVLLKCLLEIRLYQGCFPCSLTWFPYGKIIFHSLEPCNSLHFSMAPVIFYTEIICVHFSYLFSGQNSWFFFVVSPVASSSLPNVYVLAKRSILLNIWCLINFFLFLNFYITFQPLCVYVHMHADILLNRLFWL